MKFTRLTLSGASRSRAYRYQPVTRAYCPQALPPAWSCTNTQAESGFEVALSIQIAMRLKPDQFHGSGSSLSAPAHSLSFRIVTLSLNEPLPSTATTASWDKLLYACVCPDVTRVHGVGPDTSSIESNSSTGVVCPSRARAVGSRDAVTAPVVPLAYVQGPDIASNVPSEIRFMASRTTDGSDSATGVTGAAGSERSPELPPHASGPPTIVGIPTEGAKNAAARA